MATKKTKNEFARADELVLNLGKAILEDANIKSREWASLALVVQLDGGRNMFGYVFGHDGSAEAEVPEESNVIDLAGQLRDEMAKTDEPWKAMLFQASGDLLRLSFDHHGSEWAMNADNIEEIIEKLRLDADDDDLEDVTAPVAAPKKKPAAKKVVAKKPAAKKKPAPKKKPAAKKKVAPKKR
ncbi:MAG: hypothetical protein Q8K32_32200 [Archangium sp.]|nr:hypothetical protein [Archangium sp.]